MALLGEQGPKPKVPSRTILLLRGGSARRRRVLARAARGTRGPQQEQQQRSPGDFVTVTEFESGRRICVLILFGSVRVDKPPPVPAGLRLWQRENDNVMVGINHQKQCGFAAPPANSACLSPAIQQQSAAFCSRIVPMSWGHLVSTRREPS